MSVTDEIKARVDAVEFISRYVPLQRAGRSYKARCPFHEERTPSFVVFPESGTWRCFGACSTGGDLFSFLMQKENMDFREALQALAREAGVQLPEQDDAGKGQERDLLFELNAKAADFFHDQLHRAQEAQSARDYLQQRGINSQVAAQFRLGFAPESWEALRDHLVEAGYSHDTLHRADLVKHNEARDSFYDSFRNRLMIPIHDRQGRIIGFGGRVLDDSIPKYLNTAETPLFHKSYVVYGLDRAHKAIREADRVVIVEGYMDVIAAHQFGFMNVVACLGTALTTEQLSQLNRFTDNFILALDADAAGQQATLRGLNQARQALRKDKFVLTPSSRGNHIGHRLNANLRIIALQQGLDPDEIIRRNPDGWQKLVDNATPLVDHQIKIVTAQYDLGSAQGKAEAVAELIPLIAELNEETERLHYIEELSKRAGFPPLDRTVERLVQARSYALRHPSEEGRHRRRYTQPRNEPPPAEEGAQTPPNRGPLDDAGPAAPDNQANGMLWSSASDLAAFIPETKLEGFLLSFLIYDPDLLIWQKGMTEELEVLPLSGKDFQQIEYREIFVALRSFIASDELWDINAFQDTLSSTYHPVLSQLMTQIMTMPEREPADVQNALIKLLIRLRCSRLREDLSAMQFLLHDAQEGDDREAVMEYSSSINANRRDRHHLERVLVRRSQVSYGAARTDLGIVIVPESPQ